MIKASKNVLLAVTAVTLSIVGSTSFALDQSSMDGMEQVVISIRTDPLKDPEPACVALQIGMNLLMANVGVQVIPADRVSLFLTIDGVELVNPDNQINKRKKPKFVCNTPAGENTASLAGLLEEFVNMEGSEVLICPLCSDSRGITDPTQGKDASAEEIHNLFLFADKVIGF
jgi:sulfur relay (sulfurtransferase) complex TusBCD TusD component (DsrE family)